MLFLPSQRREKGRAGWADLEEGDYGFWNSWFQFPYLRPAFIFFTINRWIQFNTDTSKKSLTHFSWTDTICLALFRILFSIQIFLFFWQEAFRVQYLVFSIQNPGFFWKEVGKETKGPLISCFSYMGVFLVLLILLKGSTGDSQQWWGQGESSHQETFYSLLLQKAGSAGAETTSNSINKRGKEAAEHILDLNLKMSVGSSSIDDDESLHFSKKSNWSRCLFSYSGYLNIQILMVFM